MEVMDSHVTHRSDFKFKTFVVILIFSGNHDQRSQISVILLAGIRSFQWWTNLRPNEAYIFALFLISGKSFPPYCGR